MARTASRRGHHAVVTASVRHSCAPQKTRPLAAGSASKGQAV